MQVSRSAYYAWKANDQITNHEDMMLKLKAKELFDKSRSTYGSRRLVKALNVNGHKVGRFKSEKGNE